LEPTTNLPIRTFPVYEKKEKQIRSNDFKKSKFRGLLVVLGWPRTEGELLREIKSKPKKSKIR
jgi:hypothetical protein